MYFHFPYFSTRLRRLNRIVAICKFRIKTNFPAENQKNSSVQSVNISNQLWSEVQGLLSIYTYLFRQKMGRLKGIPKILSPDLLHAIASMGHGDEIVLADANFPAA